MDERVVKAMRGVGGYEEEAIVMDVDEGSEKEPPSPPICNGPIFDAFMQKELGGGVTAALDKGRKSRQDRNYKLRRHVDWDDTY